MPPKFSIEWTAPEFEYRDKDVAWYWISIIVAAIMIAFAVWQHNFLFGFFIVVAEILIIAWANEIPRPIVFAIDDQGFTIGAHKYYALKEFQSWSTNDIGDGAHELTFHFKNKVRPPLAAIAPADMIEELRAGLKPILREIEHQSTLIDAIEKILGF